MWDLSHGWFYHKNGKHLLWFGMRVTRCVLGPENANYCCINTQLWNLWWHSTTFQHLWTNNNTWTEFSELFYRVDVTAAFSTGFVDLCEQGSIAQHAVWRLNVFESKRRMFSLSSKTVSYKWGLNLLLHRRTNLSPFRNVLNLEAVWKILLQMIS